MEIIVDYRRTKKEQKQANVVFSVKPAGSYNYQQPLRGYRNGRRGTGGL